MKIESCSDDISFSKLLIDDITAFFTLTILLSLLSSLARSSEIVLMSSGTLGTSSEVETFSYFSPSHHWSFQSE